MDQLLATIGAGVGVFTGTNVDDLIVLTVLFLSSRASSKPKQWQIWAGQYSGIAVLIAASALAAAGLTIVPDQWVGLLGLVPIGLGLRALAKTIRARDVGEDPATQVAGSALAVAGVTIANGADNIAVYTPLFRTVGPGSSALTIAVFGALVAVWCLAGSWLASHKKVIAVVERYGHWIVPAVFIVIGAAIVLESGVIGHIADL
ncbi:cadmium resistance transporter [Actinopolymorpha pittospori]|uniref:Cadmium resistance transport/sequestration family protein n=1 Tax=Actinopolymorpha pittospori TaxID=648752 RepID=A0A927MWA0_9ACTN|nr:cadmium resistance transport/sequestration family protein [Actinopolymorpha pittospori]